MVRRPARRRQAGPPSSCSERTKENIMNVTRLAFTEDFTIYKVVELKATLIDALAAAERIELDLAQVARMDSAGCQLLLLAKREATATGKTLAIVAHSPSVQSLIEFYNLAACFGDPLVVPAR